MSPDEVLDRAADIIDRDGWTQYCFLFGRSVCAVGAMRLAIGLPAIPQCEGVLPQDVAEFGQARAELRQATGYTDITKWNDAQGRTKDEVTATMRATAATLRAQEAIQLTREAEAAK